MDSSPRPSDAGRTERRRFQRATFTTLMRPLLRLRFGTHPVLDASVSGIRALCTVPVPPRLGSVLDGQLEWPHGEPPLQVRGTVVRVEAGAFAVAFEPHTIPLGYLP